MHLPFNSTLKVDISLQPMDFLILSTGFRVFATARSSAKIESLAAKGIEILDLDVTKIESIATAKDVVKRKTGGKLDFLVNNA
jgi:1-acylglycerone phosphate reductase